MSEPHVIDLKSNSRTTMITMLNQQLASAIDLKLAVKEAHWNVRGSNFIAVHELFDAVAARVEEHVDVMAERIVQLGGKAQGTTQNVAKATALKPYPSDITSQEDHLNAVRDRLFAFGKACRDAIDEADSAGDAGTADIMTAMSRSIDKDQWFVGAHMSK